MKHFLSIILAVAAAVLASCTTDDVLGAKGSGTQRPVRLTLSIPDVMSQTRATATPTRSSALGGITNVDQTQYELRYKIAVYETPANGTPTLVKTQSQADFVVATGYEATKTISLPYDFDDTKTYKVVCWADFTDKANPTADKHYNTADMTSISCLDAATAQLNDESRDAYFVSQALTLQADNTLTLRRPFAKLRIVTTDWAQEGYDDPDAVEVKYLEGCKRFTGLNALTGVATGTDIASGQEVECSATIPTDATNTQSHIKDKYYVMSYDATEHNRTVAVDYLLADEKQSLIRLNFKAKKGSSYLTGPNGVNVGDKRTTADPDDDQQQIQTDIPIQRNYLTTILGNLCQREATTFTVSINQAFNGEWVDGEPWWSPYDFNPTEPKLQDVDGRQTYMVGTLDELAWLSCHGDGNYQIPNNNVNPGLNHDVKLTADIDMNNVTIWKPIFLYDHGDQKTHRIFNGDNHTIRNANVTIGFTYHEDAIQHLCLIDADASSIIENVKFENVTLRGLHEPQEARRYTNPQPGAQPIEYTAINYGVIGGVTHEAQWMTVRNVEVNHLFIYVNGGDKTKIANNDDQRYWINVGGIVAAVYGQDHGTLTQRADTKRFYDIAGTTGNYYIHDCKLNDAHIYLPEPSDTYSSPQDTYQNYTFMCVGGIVGLLAGGGNYGLLQNTMTNVVVHTNGWNQNINYLEHYVGYMEISKNPLLGTFMNTENPVTVLDKDGNVVSGIVKINNFATPSLAQEGQNTGYQARVPGTMQYKYLSFPTGFTLNP